MGNSYFQSVTPAHKAVLEEYGYWKHIVKNQDEVIRIGDWQPSLISIN